MAPLRPSIAIAAVALSLLAVTTTAASAQENLVGRRDDGATTTGLGGRSYTYLLSAIRSLPIATMSTRASGLVIAPSRPRVAPAQSALECQQPGPSSWPSEPAGKYQRPTVPLFCYYTKRYGRMHFSCNGGRKSMDGLAYGKLVAVSNQQACSRKEIRWNGLRRRN